MFAVDVSQSVLCGGVFDTLFEFECTQKSHLNSDLFNWRFVSQNMWVFFISTYEQCEIYADILEKYTEIQFMHM